MINISVEGLTLPQLAGVLTAVVGSIALVISYSVYRGHSRQLRLTANERLMGMVISIDKTMIDYPELMYLPRPDEFEPPKQDDKIAQARMIAFMYMHLNMFDVAYNYYCRTLGMGWMARRFFRSREEVDHWSGWKTYTAWFVALPFVEERYSREAYKWYGPQFKAFLHSLNERLPS
jgi:hypothetical protein